MGYPSYDGREPKNEELIEKFLSRLSGWDEIPEHHRAKTPERYVKMMLELTEVEEFEFTTFHTQQQDMVVLEKIPFYTLCAHHVIPFFGHAYIGYVPDMQMAGLSKFSRLVKQVSKGFWSQEELTAAIADELLERLEPKGLAVVMRAEHLCMAMRGIEHAGVITTTSSVRGVFAEHDRTAKAEFMSIIQRSW